MSAETDATLVARVRRGDRDAAGALAERYLRGCRAVALAIVGEAADADDVCQDAFVAAIERIDSCRRPERFGAWLFQIVRNRARDHLRAARLRVVPLEDAGLEAGGASPAAAAEAADVRGRLLAALEELSEERREVVLLHDLEGWTHADIAEAMELPPGTVRSHLHHARKRLRALLSPLEGGEE
jgi:RNA polymerase sigma-70 factor, ECF subfamily